MHRVTVALTLLLFGCATPAPSSDALEVLSRDWIPVAPGGTALGSWSLTDHGGESFDETRFAGRWSLVFVGYTSCPDVCPTTLAALGPALETLAVDRVQGVFIAVDPDRDRDQLAALVAYHGDALVGVTGDRAAIDRAVGQLGASYAIGAGGLIDHSTALFVVDPTGHVAGYVARPSDSSRIVAATRRAISAGSKHPTLADGWIRAGPPNATVLAGFGTLVNRSGARTALVSVEGVDFGMAHVHETVESDGVARMRAVAGLEVDAGRSVRLEPGGHHLMLMQPRRAFEVDDDTVLRLTFDSGDSSLARLRVRRP